MLALTENPSNSIMVELTIQEFDQWSNSAIDLAIRPTTICWYPPESEQESHVLVR